MFDEVGFGRPPQNGFPGEASGRVRPPWKPIEQATMSYGHGISLSLMQLARAYTIFTNDGELKPVSFMRLDQPLPGKRVIRRTLPQDARHADDRPQPGGAAPRAQGAGLYRWWWTGTAHKQEGVTPANIFRRLSALPRPPPRLIVAVIDEPQGQYYGGTVAGPVFSAVMSGSLRILGVSRMRRTNNTFDSPTAFRKCGRNMIDVMRLGR